MFVLQATLGTRYVRGRQRLYARMRSTCSYVKMERWKAEFFQLLRRPQALLLDSRYFPVVSFLLLLLDAVATTGIIWKVPYTEIDWVAYMQEVEGAINGTLDYSQLRGDTGPLVYPAGFVYIYSLLYYMTTNGENIVLAQALFAILYLLNLTIVLMLYSSVARSLQLPPYLLLFLTCTAYRIHSIFVLRMFNDPVAMFFLHCSLLFMIHHKWLPTAILFSLAVSVKMNILLYAPGLLVVFLLHLGWVGTLPLLTVCAFIQLLLGAPFLLHSPVSYIRGGFDFGRQFLYQWTVNWRCLPEWLFLHRGLHTALLVAHIIILTTLVLSQWTRAHGVQSLLKWRPVKKTRALVKTEDMLLMLFSSNLVGIVFARSLHYQFYVWYFYSLPFLLWTTQLPVILRVLVLLIVEYCWNVYPSTVISSLLLHGCHITLLVGLLWFPSPSHPPSHTDKTQ